MNLQERDAILDELKIEEVLRRIENIIGGNEPFISLETERIEIKALFEKENWTELYKTACAFLNTSGGVIIVGIKEKNKQYIWGGYDENNENGLKNLTQIFTGEGRTPLELSEYFDYKILHIGAKNSCLVIVKPLPDEIKFVYFESKAYKRVGTGDHLIKEEEIQRQKELKQRLSQSRELTLITDASLEDLDIAKINEYITYLNKKSIVETSKPDLEAAKPFLQRINFFRNEKPTLLGMLVCGRNPYDFLRVKCGVDAYVDTLGKIADVKKILRDSIYLLIERAFGFVYQHIDESVIANKGGTAVPEFPVELIRETINNALAHRDYGIDKQVYITIHPKPNRRIEITNPGDFSAEQKLSVNLENAQKIRVIIPKKRRLNPQLAEILIHFDRYEGRGKGMSDLVKAALNNQIDVPYFRLIGDEVSLNIPKGSVFDEAGKLWLEGFEGYITQKLDGRAPTQEEKTILCYFYKSERLNGQEKFTLILSDDNNHLSVINKLETSGLIFRAVEVPNFSPVYRLDPVLTQTEFHTPLREIFGEENYNLLSNDEKDVLNAVFLFENYGARGRQISAKFIANYLFNKQGKKSNALENEKGNYERKIRGLFNVLEKGSRTKIAKRPRIKKGNFILKKEENAFDYKINVFYLKDKV